MIENTHRRDILNTMPETIGPYRLLKLIGEGGMGSVYLAERENEFRKRVAIKLIRGEIATEDVVRRFVMERHMLAALNHPHIVRLVDGGATPDGLPYLVVDYVDGIPIDRYCAEHKLAVNDRLRLFVEVAAAVHYAHQSLIIHCDLKPGNILVTADGAPMLLDFGIAKLLDPIALGLGTQTQTRHRAFTPQYASPEQLRGEPVTTACDIYALGVILYELLTGRSPYRATATDSLVDWVRSVCDEEAKPPSTGSGDLDAIALKALRKDPRERYSSVDQMAEDVRRHLTGRPVLARHNTAGYVARKFLQRHKYAAIVAALLLLSLGAGLATTLWEARIAARRFNDVRSLAHTFLFDVHDSIQNLPGSTEARQLIASTGAAYLDRLSRDSRGNRALQLELADGYLKIGDVEGNPFASNLGNTGKAEENYRKALSIADGAGGVESREVLAKAHMALASVLPFRNQAKEASTHAQKSLELARAIASAKPQDVEAKLLLSRASETLGDVQGGLQSGNLGLPQEALKSYQESLAAIPDVPAASEYSVRAGRAKAVVMSKIADLTARNGENQAAEGVYQSALAIARELLKRDPGNTRSQAVVTAILNKLATSETDRGEVQKALGHFRESNAITEAALAADPNNDRARYSVAVDQKNMGDLFLYIVQNGEEALRCYRKAADMLEEACRRDPHNMVYRERLADILTEVATCLIATGKPQEARKPAERGLAMAKELADRPGATLDQVYTYAWLAVTVDPENLRTPAAALPYARKAVELSHGENSRFLYVLAEAYAGTGDYRNAVATAEKAVALFPPLPAGQSAPHNQAVVERALARYREKFAGH